MSEIQRPGALYRQVAAAIRDAIAAGEYEAGKPLPSEAQLIDRYGVSRPTVRNAIAALRAEGLIEVTHGKGSFVRDAPTAVATIDRAVTRDGKGAYFTDYGTWELKEEPTVYRTHTNAETGPPLELDQDEALFGVDRLLTDPETGTRLAHRVLLPFATVEGTELADEPDANPETIYSVLDEAGHNLWWTESVRARMPLPDERATLEIPEATPVIHTSRVTYGRDNRPLLLEELRMNGNRAQLAFRITMDTPRKLRAFRD